MTQPRLIRTMTVTAVAILSLLLASAAPSAASADTTAPSPPLFGYAQGFQCLSLIIGVQPSTDNVTPQSALRYRVLANGVDLGSLTDRGPGAGVWGVLQLRQAGPNTVTVQAVDKAGNRSSSRAVVVTGHFTPGCSPIRIG